MCYTLIRKKFEKYPILEKAHYYPILNKLNLTNEEKRNIDEVLYYFKGYFYMSNLKQSISSFLKEENKNKIDEIIDFLINNKIIEKRYVFECGCFSPCSRIMLKEEDKNRFYEYHDFDYRNATDEEIEEHENNYQDGYIYVDCYNDNEIEIETIEDFEQEAEIVYEIIAKPDRSLDRI